MSDGHHVPGTSATGSTQYCMGMCVICERAVKAMSTPSNGHAFCATVILIDSTVDYDNSLKWIGKNVH